MNNARERSQTRRTTCYMTKTKLMSWKDQEFPGASTKERLNAKGHRRIFWDDTKSFIFFFPMWTIF